jgi:hypothetical protein
MVAFLRAVFRANRPRGPWGRVCPELRKEALFLPSHGRIRDGASTLCPGVTGGLMFIARTPGQSVLAPPRILPGRSEILLP